jgi:hypothetical protein
VALALAIALALACSFDHVWRLSKQIFALELAALAFQRGSSNSRRLLIQEFHPMRLHKGVSPCEYSKQEFHLWERSLERSFTLENLCRWLCRCFTDWLFALAAAHAVLKNSQGTEQARAFQPAKLALGSWHFQLMAVNRAHSHGLTGTWRRRSYSPLC